MGSKSGGTKVIHPKAYEGDIWSSQGGGGYPGIRPEATHLYRQGIPSYYPGHTVAPWQSGELAMRDYTNTAAPTIGKFGLAGLGQAAGLAGYRSETGEALARTGQQGINRALMHSPYQQLENTGNWRGTVAELSQGRMNPYAGSSPRLGNIGDWQGTVGEQGLGLVNPYIDAASGAATNQLFRGVERAAGLSQDTFNLSAQRARDEFDRAQQGAIGSYQRATQPVMADLEDQLSTLGRDFNEQVLPSIRGQASAVGGYGGSRHAIADALAARGLAEGTSKAIGRIGEGFGLGAGQMGESLGLGASQLSSSLGLGARQGAMDIHRMGAQAAEQAGDISSRMYGSAFENAQARALQAAGLGLQGSTTAAGLEQQGIQNLVNSYEANQARRLSAAGLGADMSRAQEALRQQGIANYGQLALGAGGLGNQMIGTAGNIALGGLGAMPGLASTYASPASMYQNVGGLERGIEQSIINEQIARHNYPHQAKWQNLMNYSNIMNAASPQRAAGQVLPAGTSRFGSALGGGLAGAGTGYMIGGVPGAAIGGGVGFLGGVL